MAQWPLTIGGPTPEQSGLEWLSLSQWGKLDCFSGDYSDFSDTAERAGCLVAWLLLLIECDKVLLRTFRKFLHKFVINLRWTQLFCVRGIFSFVSYCCQALQRRIYPSLRYTPIKFFRAWCLTKWGWSVKSCKPPTRRMAADYLVQKKLKSFVPRN